MEDRYLWELIGKKASGEANEAELKELGRLLQDRPDVHYMLEMMDNYWSLPGAQSEEVAITESLERHKNRLKQRQLSPLEKTPVSLNARLLPMHQPVRRRVLLLAASLALLIATGSLTIGYYNSLSFTAHTVATKLGSKTRLLLPDSTVIWLNAGSKLSYPRHFKTASLREVSLSGEAFFEVKHDRNRPFIIHTRYLDIRDIGTAFDVKAYPRDKLVEATLIRGSIEVTLRAHPKEKVVLRPNEKLAYYVDATDNTRLIPPSAPDSVQEQKNSELPPIAADTHIAVRKIIPVVNPSGGSIVSETAWINNQLVFSNERFEDLAAGMERWYNMKIVISDQKIAGYTFTGIFQGETVEEALKELQMIRPFHFTVHGNEVDIFP